MIKMLSLRSNLDWREGAMFNSSEFSVLMETMIGTLDPNETVVRKTLMAGKYDVALRQACGSKLYPLIIVMLDNIQELSIDLNAKSSNGNTALDWLDTNAPSSASREHLAVKTALCNKGAIGGKEQIYSTVDFDKNAALFLGVDELAVSYHNSDYPVIGSVGAGQCIILAVYDSEHKKALLTHIASLNNRSTKMLDTLNNELSSFSPAHSNAYIVGGVDNSISRTTHQKITQLLNHKNISIKYQKVFQGSYHGESSESESFAINAFNGRCYSNVDLGHFEYTEERLIASTEVPPGEIAVVENRRSDSSSLLRK